MLHDYDQLLASIRLKNRVDRSGTAYGATFASHFLTILVRKTYTGMTLIYAGYPGEQNPAHQSNLVHSPDAQSS